MAENVSVYFRDEDEEELEWIDMQVDEGDKRNRAAAIISCIKFTRDNYEDIEEFI